MRLNKIKLGEHVFSAGMTGSGKTVCAKHYLAGQKNVIVYDTKGTFNWGDLIPDIPIFTSLNELMTFGDGKAIYRPDYNELDKEYTEAFFKWIYFRRNCWVLVDELMSFCTERYIPEFLKAILTRGRERNTSTWCSTQRPKTIPLVCISEATHHFIYRLNVKSDRDRIKEVIGAEEFEQILPKYVFWYYNINMDKPVKAKLVLK